MTGWAITAEADAMTGWAVMAESDVMTGRDKQRTRLGRCDDSMG